MDKVTKGGDGSGKYSHKKSGIVKNLVHTFYDSTNNEDESGVSHVYSTRNKKTMNPNEALKLEAKKLASDAKKLEESKAKISKHPKIHQYLFQDLLNHLDHTGVVKNNWSLLQRTIMNIMHNVDKFKHFPYENIKSSLTEANRVTLRKKYLINVRGGGGSDIEPTDGVKKAFETLLEKSTSVDPMEYLGVKSSDIMSVNLKPSSSMYEKDMEVIDEHFKSLNSKPRNTFQVEGEPQLIDWQKYTGNPTEKTIKDIREDYNNWISNRNKSRELLNKKLKES